jgi:hypothetical protein
MIFANAASHLTRDAPPYLTPRNDHPAPSPSGSPSAMMAPANFAHAGSLFCTCDVIAASISAFNAGRRNGFAIAISFQLFKKVQCQ